MNTIIKVRKLGESTLRADKMSISRYKSHVFRFTEQPNLYRAKRRSKKHQAGNCSINLHKLTFNKWSKNWLKRCVYNFHIFCLQKNTMKHKKRISVVKFWFGSRTEQCIVVSLGKTPLRLYSHNEAKQSTGRGSPDWCMTYQALCWYSRQTILMWNARVQNSITAHLKLKNV